MNVSVKSVTVVTNTGSTDKVLVEVDLPGALKFTAKDKLTMSFEASPGLGEEYCRQHLRFVPIEVIDVKSGRRS